MSSSREIPDIPEWTGEKFWEPDPDDVALFQERPEDAAEVYRNLFISNDRKLLGFMHAFPVVDRTPRQEELLWSSGFPLALLESLTDSRWYESFNDMATHSGFVQYVYATIESIQFALAIQNLLALMVAISPDPLTHNKAFEQCFQHFPDMWKLVWRYRDIVLSDSFDVANEGVRSYIGGLLQRYCRIYRGISSQAPPLESYVAHIALYLLVIPQNPDATTHCDPAYLLMSVLKQEGRAALEREHSFLNEVVPTVTGGANLKGFTRIIRRDLVQRRPTTAEQFQNTLSATGLLLMWGPPMVTPERNGGRRLVLLALAAAAQRYECHGCDDEQWTDLHRRPVFLAEPFLDVYIGLIASAGEGAHALMTNDIVNNPYHFSFTHVLARSMATACEKNWSNLQKVFQHFMNAYLTVASLGRTRYHTDRARWRKYCYLRRILQVHWLPSLARMRAALHVSNSQSGPDPAGQDSLQGIVKRWADLGRAFNLSDSSREKDSGLRSYVTEEELRLGCFYPECLCYGEKPLHGIRRVCTGCWSVYYCGERCQKKDWLLGHRNVCGGRSASADVARRHTGGI